MSNASNVLTIDDMADTTQGKIYAMRPHGQHLPHGRSATATVDVEPIQGLPRVGPTSAGLKQPPPSNVGSDLARLTGAWSSIDLEDVDLPQKGSDETARGSDETARGSNETARGSDGTGDGIMRPRTLQLEGAVNATKEISNN